MKKDSPQTPSEVSRIQEIPYASAFGSAIYAILCTRPNVSYALCLTRRYKSDLREEDWTTVKNILKFLLRTKDLFLIYSGGPDLTIICYSDTSF